jgi:hypothetical protein
VISIANSLTAWLVIGIVLAWLLWQPGACLLARCTARHPHDRIVRVVLYSALSIAFWQLLLLWTSTLGWRWTSFSARCAVLLIGATGAALLFAQVRNLRSGFAGRHPKRRVSAGAALQVAFFVLVLVVLATRILHVQSLVLPNWIDSLHHTMIVQMIVEQGQLPRDYSPYIPASAAVYHWGFHAMVAWLVWLIDSTPTALSIAGTMLIFGQFLGVLFVPLLYASGRSAFNSRRAGLFAALLGSLVMWYPAYYAAWGRYPQLLGLYTGVALLLGIWAMRGQQSRWVPLLLGLLAASLLVTHSRTAIYIAVFLLPILMWAVVRRRWRLLGNVGLTAVWGCALALPWLIKLATTPLTQALAFVPHADSQLWWLEQNGFSWALFWTPGMHEVLALLTGGISGLLRLGNPPSWLWVLSLCWVALLILVGGLRYYRIISVPVTPLLRVACLTTLWIGTMLVAANLPVFGLPALGFVNNNAVVIALFLPLAVSAGGLLAYVVGIFTPQRLRLLAPVAIALVIAFYGAWRMRDIVNPATVLANSADVTALQWVQANTAPDARFAIMVRRWLGNSYVGIDGGYWLGILSDRSSVAPPAIYTLVTPYDAYQQLNESLRLLSDPRALINPVILTQLKQLGITHLFIGALNATAPREELLLSPAWNLIYNLDNVLIFELR